MHYAHSQVIDGVGYSVADFYARLCQHPYRSLDGGATFVDLIPAFQHMTNAAYPRSAPEPMPQWRILAGRVNDVGIGTNRGNLLVRVDKAVSGLGVAGGGAVVQLRNYPGADHANDGMPLECLALLVGRHTYRDISGAINVVLSYDYGTIPTPEQFNAIQSLKRSNHLARLHAAQSNHIARLHAQSNLARSNYTITPVRPPR